MDFEKIKQVMNKSANMSVDPITGEIKESPKKQTHMVEDYHVGGYNVDENNSNEDEFGMSDRLMEALSDPNKIKNILNSKQINPYLVSANIPVNESSQPKVEKPKATQNTSSDYILVSKTELKNMINETLMDFMFKFKTTIEEEAVKTTIKTILKEQKNKRG